MVTRVGGNSSDDDEAALVAAAGNVPVEILRSAVVSARTEARNRRRRLSDSDLCTFVDQVLAADGRR